MVIGFLILSYLSGSFWILLQTVRDKEDVDRVRTFSKSLLIIGYMVNTSKIYNRFQNVHSFYNQLDKWIYLCPSQFTIHVESMMKTADAQQISPRFLITETSPSFISFIRLSHVMPWHNQLQDARKLNYSKPKREIYLNKSSQKQKNTGPYAITDKT